MSTAGQYLSTGFVVAFVMSPFVLVAVAISEWRAR